MAIFNTCHITIFYLLKSSTIWILVYIFIYNFSKIKISLLFKIKDKHVIEGRSNMYETNSLDSCLPLNNSHFLIKILILKFYIKLNVPINFLKLSWCQLIIYNILLFLF